MATTKPKLKKTAAPKKPAPKSASKKAKAAVVADPSRDLALLMAQVAHDTKAENVVVLDLQKVGGFTDYFVIASGSSDRQVRAICDRITEALKKQTPKPIYPLGVEGLETSHWILIDCGSVIAHIFYKEAREFYALEKLWGDAPRLKLSLK